ncbi:Unannotated [Lentimonas sp. CC4]|nr:Unannotated [Lentimonas sp. CC4]CAA6686160.1 Unannotated [Lentimonas sp. CC6]CAA7074192.1 Unannotated [Lentimonas sp. CC4]CAA7171550.1 Unannotated [Lentimonas sp. CC21]CAA7182030.1 Unannotated [Lentimonas sp. CC8]
MRFSLKVTINIFYAWATRAVGFSLVLQMSFDTPTTRGMKSFEAFKTSREKMDPSTRKMSDHQWQQAYAAYCNARGNPRGGRSSGSKSGSSRRRSSTKSSSQGMHTPSAVSASGALRAQVRAESAYADQRLLVNVLSWVILAAIMIVALLQAIMLPVPAAAGAVLLFGGIQALAVIILRMIVHVIIDIPDVALYCACDAQKAVAETAGES